MGLLQTTAAGTLAVRQTDCAVAPGVDCEQSAPAFLGPILAVSRARHHCGSLRWSSPVQSRFCLVLSSSVLSCPVLYEPAITVTIA